MKRTKRRYVLRARGVQMADTRARIVQAMIQLHQEVGPSRTTVSAIAERADVERLTVYRHFKDESEMLAACSHRYFELNPPPSPSAWTDEPDPARRSRRALQDFYAFFSRTAPMFEKVYRDASENRALKNVMDQFDAHLRAMADGLAAAWPRDKGAGKRQLILRHAIKFSTWQSLESDRVGNGQKVDLMLGWLSA